MRLHRAKTDFVSELHATFEQLADVKQVDFQAGAQEDHIQTNLILVWFL